MIDAVHRPFPVKFFAFGNKIRIVRLENTGVDIVGGRAAESKKAHTVDFKNLPAYQMKDIIRNPVYLSAVLFGHGIYG